MEYYQDKAVAWECEWLVWVVSEGECIVWVLSLEKPTTQNSQVIYKGYFAFEVDALDEEC